MNQKEVGELRRRLTPEKTSISKIYGCYVNQNKTIIARMEASVGLMPESEAERYMTLFRRSLSGSLGKNLVDLSFSIPQVTGGEEHKLLSDLRSTMLSDEALRERFYQKIVESLTLEDKNYLILLAADAYDVPRRNKNDEDDDGSDSIFRYLLCAVCPVNEEKSELGYFHAESTFHTTASQQIVAAPVLGFLFPAFDGRTANIYNALYYTKDAGDLHEPFLDAVFHTEIPMSAVRQKDTFSEVLAETLDKDCSFEAVQSLHEELRTRLEMHKEAKVPVPLEITARDVEEILVAGGVPSEKAESFRHKCSEEFGSDFLVPSNVINAKKFELETPEVKITVDPKCSGMIETRVIDGKKYLLIPADHGVELNGMNVVIGE